MNATNSSNTTIDILKLTAGSRDGLYLPIYIMTGVFGAIFIIGPLFFRKNPNKDWVTVYISQMNPLLEPRLHNTTLAWVLSKRDAAFASTTQSNDMLNLWHQRMGHLDIRNLLLLTNKIATGVIHVEVIGVEKRYLVMNDGHRIPKIALSIISGDTKEPLRDVVFWAIKAGYRHLDTVPYNNSEPEVGLGIANAIAESLVRREQLFVTAKLGYFTKRREQVLPALRKSLERLDLKYVDLYLVHFPFSVENNWFAAIDYLESWQGMEEARRLGLTKSIGVFNFNASQVDRLIGHCRIKPAVIQIEIHPMLTLESKVSHYHELGIVVMAFSPFGYMDQPERQNDRPPRVDEPLLVHIADKYNKTTLQVVTRYHVDRGVIPVPRVRTQEQFKSYIDIYDFKLTEEEIAAISNFNQNFRILSNDSWKVALYYPWS